MPIIYEHAYKQTKTTVFQCSGMHHGHGRPRLCGARPLCIPGSYWHSCSTNLRRIGCITTAAISNTPSNMPNVFDEVDVPSFLRPSKSMSAALPSPLLSASSSTAAARRQSSHWSSLQVVARAACLRHLKVCWRCLENRALHWEHALGALQGGG